MVYVIVTVYTTVTIINLITSTASGSNSSSGRAAATDSSTRIGARRRRSIPAGSGSNGCAITNITRGGVSSYMNVAICSRTDSCDDFCNCNSSNGDSSSNGRAGSDRNSNILVLRSNNGACVVAYTRIVDNNSSFAMALGSNARCSTSVITCSDRASVKILSVGTANLGVTAFTGSSSITINRRIITVNYPNNVRFVGDMADNCISTVSHPISSGVNCSGGYVRASTTVGPNGDNNTLFGVRNRIVNVGSSGVTSARCRNVNFTIPDGATISATGDLVGSNCIRNETGLNVACGGVSDCSGTSTVLDTLSRGNCGSTGNAVIVNRMDSSSSLTGGSVGRCSVVITMGKAAVASASIVASILSSDGPNSAVGLAVTEVRGGRVGAFSIRYGLIRSGNDDG